MATKAESHEGSLDAVGGLKARCPACGSLAVNKYGKSYSGKKRYICFMCGRQFLPGSERLVVRERPPCPVCGQPMYRYIWGQMLDEAWQGIQGKGNMFEMLDQLASFKTS